MTYDEALRLLGLEEGATEADIKLAYKELAQILHPDKFAGNKKLSERANEQFKMVNEARELLLSRKTSSRRGARQGGAGGSGDGSGSRASRSGTSGYSSYDSETYDRVVSLRARLAGIAAAKTQLTAQLDFEHDRRRIAAYLMIGGLVGMIIGAKIRIVEPFGGTALIWGVVQYFSSQSNIKKMKEHIAELEKDRKKCAKELEKL